MRAIDLKAGDRVLVNPPVSPGSRLRFRSITAEGAEVVTVDHVVVGGEWRGHWRNRRDTVHFTDHTYVRARRDGEWLFAEES